MSTPQQPPDFPPPDEQPDEDREEGSHQAPHQPTGTPTQEQIDRAHAQAVREETSRAGTDPGPLRRAVEQASRPALELLSRLPVWLPFLVLLGLLLGGGFLGGPVGWVLVGVALLFILWLFYLGWPRMTWVERLMRLAVLAVFLAVTVTQLMPRG